MQPPRNLEIRGEVPLIDRIQSGIGATLEVLLLRGPAAGMWDAIYLVMLASLISYPIWVRTNVEFAVVLWLILLGFLVAWGMLGVPRTLRWVGGPPVFGRLGGQQRNIFFATMRCASRLRKKLNSQWISSES